MKLGMMGLVVAAVLAVGGCKSEQKTTAEAPAAMSVNKTCPIGGHSADGKTMVAYKGKTIGFCCEDCVTEFNKMSAAEKDAVLAKASTGK